MTCKCHGGEESLAHYSPWSCSTISPFESVPHHLSTHSSSKQLVSGRFRAHLLLHLLTQYHISVISFKVHQTEYKTGTRGVISDHIYKYSITV